MIMRNFITAPVTEEIVFRGLLVPLMIFAYAAFRSDDGGHVYSPFSIIIRSPIWFGVAHLHHIVEKLRSGERVLVAVLSTLIQLTYTSIFGAIAAAFLIQTGNILAPITSHIFCNFWGLPNLEFVKPPIEFRNSTLAYLYPYRHVLISVHLLGLIMFAILFESATRPFTDDSVFLDVFRNI